MNLPTLDAHGHIAVQHSPQELAASGAVLAMTLSLEQGARAVHRREPYIVWAVGCHPRIAMAQDAFDPQQFEQLVERAAIVGEIGLDSGSRVPMELQLRNFRQELEVLSRYPRLASIHSYAANGLVLRELRSRPIPFPVMHWWTGTAAETSEAVELGCYFSIHSQVARQSKFRTRVPIERILVESDHGFNDPPAAIPCRIEWVEHLVAQHYHVSIEQLRRRVWQNLATIVEKTRTHEKLPGPFKTVLANVPDP